MQQDKYISKYIKNVKKAFPWGYPNKKNIIKELKLNLKLFFSEHPDASYKDLCEHFGSSDSYIETIMSLYSPDELCTNLQIKKRKYIIVGLIVSIIIISVICSIAYANYFIEKHFPTTVNDEIIIDDDIIFKDELVFE